MPRKHRIKYPGAIYHVISRGNYRKDLFSVSKSGDAFEKALFETMDRCGWQLFAYVIMSNHFHVALKTPEPNLVAGIKWLQSTFATRFSRFTGERGHVFQGRYKSLLVEEDRPLLGLIDYIHLNPVRAGICSLENLKNYRLSSYPKFLKRSVRDGLNRKCLLSLIGQPDDLSAMRVYEAHLSLVDEKDPGRREELSKQYTRGWYIGSVKAKKALARDLVTEHAHVRWEGVDLAELNEARWEAIVKGELEHMGLNESSILDSAKGAAWKVAIARKLRNETTAGNPWIAKRLKMGHPNYVSNLIHGKSL
jgi:putative transposase